MKVLTLKRIAMRADGVFGVLIDEGAEPFCLTLERPWNNNKPEISCIPKGEYLCDWLISPKFGQTFCVSGVPGRTNILFHKGNFYTDSMGCILLGEEFQPINGVRALQMSGAAFSEFIKRVGQDRQFRLVVIEC